MGWGGPVKGEVGEGENEAEENGRCQCGASVQYMGKSVLAVATHAWG